MSQNLLKNRYRIIETLGVGGFGETFLAEDTQMPSGRKCAIKQLKPINNDPKIYQTVQERFGREAAILEKLSQGSDRIPELYAYFEEDGQFYLVQEWIDGKTLFDQVQEHGIMGENQVKNILGNILMVLDFIHSQGMIHRDIKPDNIIWRDRDKIPVLIDFGAVKETMGTALNSQGKPISSMLVGTPGFMASEQATGNPLFNSDIFSLGMTAIYLLTGKIPQELQRDGNNNEFIWRYYAPTISAKFAKIIDKAIRFHPSDRYATAQEMLIDLQIKVNKIGQTERSLPPRTIVSKKDRTNLSFKQKLISNWQSLQDWHKATIIGVVAGAIVGLGFSLIYHTDNSEKNTENQSLSGNETTENQENMPINCQGLPIPNKAFYFLIDSAFNDPNSAQRKCKNLTESGYKNTGFLASQTYTNLPDSDNPYKVYIDLFEDKATCEKELITYRKKQPKAYCALASKRIENQKNPAPPKK